jgi:hypothetical protein
VVTTFFGAEELHFRAAPSVHTLNTILTHVKVKVLDA